MRMFFLAGALVWMIELLWLPAAVSPGRWQTTLWAETAALRASVPEMLAELPPAVETAAFEAVATLAAPVLRGFEPTGDAAGRVLRRSGRSVASMPYFDALGLEWRLIMKRSGVILLAFGLSAPFLIGVGTDAAVRRRIRSDELHAPKPVLFNACVLAVAVSALAVGLALPVPMPIPLWIFGTIPVIFAGLLHCAWVHYHRFI